MGNRRRQRRTAPMIHPTEDFTGSVTWDPNGWDPNGCGPGQPSCDGSCHGNDHNPECW